MSSVWLRVGVCCRKEVGREEIRESHVPYTSLPQNWLSLRNNTPLNHKREGWYGGGVGVVGWGEKTGGPRGGIGGAKLPAQSTEPG